jgi:hypothetical protein
MLLYQPSKKQSDTNSFPSDGPSELSFFSKNRHPSQIKKNTFTHIRRSASETTPPTRQDCHGKKMRSPKPTNPKLAHPRASNLTLKQKKRPKKKNPSYLSTIQRAKSIITRNRQKKKEKKTLPKQEEKRRLSKKSDEIRRQTDRYPFPKIELTHSLTHSPVKTHKPRGETPKSSANSTECKSKYLPQYATKSSEV